MEAVIVLRLRKWFCRYLGHRDAAFVTARGEVVRVCLRCLAIFKNA